MYSISTVLLLWETHQAKLNWVLNHGKTLFLPTNIKKKSEKNIDVLISGWNVLVILG